MAARELARAGKQVTILEARDRCGGRILSLPASEFGYRAEGGAEFIHGKAPVTHGLLREAGLSVVSRQGSRWNAENGTFTQDERLDPQSGDLYARLTQLQADMTVAAFLQQYFAGPEYAGLRHSVLRMVEGYDAADPERASMLAVRDEWTSSGRGKSSRVVGGYGALIDFLTAECRKLGVKILHGAVVSAIETAGQRTLVRCANGDSHAGDIAVLTVPLPVLQEIALPPALREKSAAAADIGFGNVIKFLLGFKSCWWAHAKGKDLSDLTFLISRETIPVWWTQYPNEYPVLTGWAAGPRTKRMANIDESALIDMGLVSLARTFDVSPDTLRQELVAARAIDWAKDPFARGAYSYATPETRAARSVLAGTAGEGVVFSGEAFHEGEDMGTFEAALANGRETAQVILSGAKP